MAVLLVRHGAALARREWEGDDDDRPLNGRGRRQAGGLVDQLASFEPVRVLSSPAVRCVGTVERFAEAKGVAVERTAELAEGKGARAADLVGSLVHTTGHAVLCTHGDVIAEVLFSLERQGVRLDEDRCQKGSTWVIERDASGDIRARYLPPPI